MEPWIFPWWLWAALGLLLMAAELIVPTGFFVFFFGMGALVTGLATAIGLVQTLVPQALLLLVVSAASVALFRKPLMATFHKGGHVRKVDSLAGETAVAIDAIAPGDVGKVELRGSTWSASNSGDAAIAAGARCRVESVEGLTLRVRI